MNGRPKDQFRRYIFDVDVAKWDRKVCFSPVNVDIIISSVDMEGTELTGSTICWEITAISTRRMLAQLSISRLVEEDETREEKKQKRKK